MVLFRFFYIFADFLSTCSVDYWERSEVTNCKYGSVSPFTSVSFCSAFEILPLGGYTFGIVVSSWLVLFLTPGNTLWSQVYFVYVNVALQFSCEFSWYSFSHSFIFNLPKSLYLKWVSWSQHIARCWYFHPIWSPFNWYIQCYYWCG